MIQKSLLGISIFLLPLGVEARHSGSCEIGGGTYTGPANVEDGKNKPLATWALGFNLDWKQLPFQSTLRVGQRLDLERGDRTPETDGFIEIKTNYVHTLSETFSLLPGAGLGYYNTTNSPFTFLSLMIGLEYKLSPYFFLGLEGHGALGALADLPRMFNAGAHFRVEI